MLASWGSLQFANDCTLLSKGWRVVLSTTGGFRCHGNAGTRVAVVKTKEFFLSIDGRKRHRMHDQHFYVLWFNLCEYSGNSEKISQSQRSMTTENTISQKKSISVDVLLVTSLRWPRLRFSQTHCSLCFHHHRGLSKSSRFIIHTYWLSVFYSWFEWTECVIIGIWCMYPPHTPCIMALLGQYIRNAERDQGSLGEKKLLIKSFDGTNNEHNQTRHYHETSEQRAVSHATSLRCDVLFSASHLNVKEKQRRSRTTRRADFGQTVTSFCVRALFWRPTTRQTQQREWRKMRLTQFSKVNWNRFNIWDIRKTIPFPADWIGSTVLDFVVYEPLISGY